MGVGKGEDLYNSIQADYHVINMPIKIIKKKISKDEIKEIAEESFGKMFKIVVDIERKILAAGGELHADSIEPLLDDGSEAKNLWGANFYLFKKPEKRIKYNALINIRPERNNRKMEIEDKEIREKVKQVAEDLLLSSNEQIT